MTDKNENNSFGGRLKEALDLKLIALVLLIIWQIGEGIWLNYQAGADAAKYEQFKADARKVIEEEVAVPNLLMQIIDSDFVTEFADEKRQEIEAQIIAQVMADSGEVDFITLLGQETGLRDEVVAEKFKAMFKLYVDGELLTKKQANEVLATRNVTVRF